MMKVPAPLIVSRDPVLLETAVRWCAAVGYSPEIADDAHAAHRWWRTASAVLIGADVLNELVSAHCSRRDHVITLTCGREVSWTDVVAIGSVGVFAIPDDEAAGLEALTLAVDGRGEACLVSVTGAVGGAGSSTFAAVLAGTGAHRGLKTLLLDADPMGGGLELVLGAEHAQGLRWNDLISAEPASGTIGAGSLGQALPLNDDGLATLSWGRETAVDFPASAPAILNAALRGFDLVVADVPRSVGDMGIEILSRSVLTILVVPEDVRGVAVARQAIDRLSALTGTLAVVARPRRSGLGVKLVAETLGIPVISRFHEDRKLALSIERGYGPGRRRRARKAAVQVLDALGLIP